MPVVEGGGTMRLDVLENGHRLRVRLFMWAVSRRTGVPVADMVKVLLYRPEFFGRAMIALAAEAMRGPSFWTPAEREYLAWRTARAHQSPFVAETHGELVRIVSAGENDLDEPDSPRPEVWAVLELVEERGARTPATASAGDGVPARADGVPVRAVVEALVVSLVIGTVSRVANAFDLRFREGQLEDGARSLHQSSYRFPAFLTGGGGPRVDGSPERYDRLVADLRQSVFVSPGVTDPATRRAAGAGATVGRLWDPYAAKVRDASHTVIGADVDELRSAGHSEDAIFEVTVAAALGASLRSFDAAVRS